MAENKAEIYNLYRETEKKILEIILKQEVDSRKKVMKNEYIECLRKSCPWLFDIINLDETYERESEQTIHEQIRDLINKISRDNSKKSIYVGMFLQRFSDLSEQDRRVLLNQLVSLPLDKLKEELQQLVEIFYS